MRCGRGHRSLRPALRLHPLERRPRAPLPHRRRGRAQAGGAGDGGGTGGRPSTPRQDLLRPPPRPVGPDPALRATGRAGRSLPRLHRPRRGRLHRGDRRAVPDPHGRAHGGRPCIRLPRQGHPAPAGKVARPQGRGDPLPPALRGSRHESRGARSLRGEEPAHPRHARLSRRPRLPRGRDADDAADPRRRDRQALRHSPQCARHGALSPDRPRALSQAAGGGRARSGLRDQPELPQRGDVDPAQSRVHHARVLPGLRRLPGPHGPHRGDVLPSEPRDPGGTSLRYQGEDIELGGRGDASRSSKPSPWPSGSA